MEQQTRTTRIEWLDVARGLCMTLLILDHTESYYIDTHHVLQYNWYVSNIICAFVFISGFLFPQHNTLNVAKKLKSVVKNLLFPYFFFTTIIALPKAFVHGIDINFITIITNIVLGRASWFVTALIVAQLLFIAVVKTLKNNYYAIYIVSLLLFYVGYYIKEPFDNIYTISQAFVFMPFMALGFVAKCCNFKLKGFVVAILLIVVVAIKIYVEKNNLSFVIYYNLINNAPLFLIDNVLGCVIIVFVSKAIARVSVDNNNKHIFNLSSLFSHTGRYSIECYFLAGGVPFIIGKTIERLGFAYDEQYYRVIIVFVLNYIAINILAIWAKRARVFVADLIKKIAVR